VLLRGGLDDAGHDAPGHDGGSEDADWRAFCERIGWQHVDAALPDDYEERLAARIFAEDTAATGAELHWRDDPVSIGVERVQRAARLAEGAAAPWRPRARRAFTTATMAVAAFLCAASSVMFWRAARTPVGAVACPDTDASPRANIAPVVDRAAPVDPSERRRDPMPRARPPKADDAPTGPAPSDAKPQKSTPPGSMVAHRSRHDHARPHGASRRVTMDETPEPPPQAFMMAETMGESAKPPPQAFMMGESAKPPPQTFTMRETPVADLPATTPGLGLTMARANGVALASTLPVIPRAWSEARTPEVWTRPASFGQAVVPASATWSLSPESPRWYGVGLPPSSGAAGVPAGVGVMAQVDVRKALDGR
jgi:hypothetical protein